MQKPACSARLLLSLCALIALWCVPSRAQPNAIRVLYSRQVPRGVREKMPRGWKSRFFGACKLPSLKQEVLFHFSSKVWVAPEGSQGIRREPLPCVLDVFARTKHGRRQIVRLLNTVHFGYEDVWEFNRVQANVMWADPKTQRIPLLKMAVEYTNGEFGPGGEDVLVNFPRGLSSEGNAQQFSSYGNTLEYYSNKFDQVDERGLAVIVQLWGNSSVTAATATKWLWSGEKFIASAPKDVTPK